MPPLHERNAMKTNKTNTGHKNHEGRTIWRGPNGGMFIVRNGVRINMSRDAFERHIEHENRYVHGLHKGPHRY